MVLGPCSLSAFVNNLQLIAITKRCYKLGPRLFIVRYSFHRLYDGSVVHVYSTARADSVLVTCQDTRELRFWGQDRGSIFLSDCQFPSAVGVDSEAGDRQTFVLLSTRPSHDCGELHALSVESHCLQLSDSDGSVKLLCQVGFLAKNSLPSVSPSPFVIPSLSQSCGSHDPVRLLCPVRALQFYLAATESFVEPGNVFLIRLKVQLMFLLQLFLDGLFRR